SIWTVTKPGSHTSTLNTTKTHTSTSQKHSGSGRPRLSWRCTRTVQSSHGPDFARTVCRGTCQRLRGSMSDWFINVFVNGTRRAQGSLRHVGKGRMIHDPKMLDWRDRMQDVLTQWQGTYFGEWEPINEPVEVSAVFWLKRPQKPTQDRAATSLDLDKLQRCAGDALEKSGVLKNDARIVRWRAEKHWTHDIEGTDGFVPGVRWKVRKTGWRYGITVLSITGLPGIRCGPKRAGSG